MNFDVMNMVRFLLLIAIVVPVSTDSYAQEQASQPLTLDQAFEQALLHNHAIRIESFAREISRNAVFRGNAGQLPTLNLTGSASFSRENSEIELTDFENEGNNRRISTEGAESVTLTAGVELGYTIFDGFSGRYRYRRLQNQDRITWYSTRMVMEQTLLEVARAYFDVLQQQENLEIVRDNLNLSETRLETVREAQRYGNARRLDVLNAEVAFNSDRITLEDAQNSLNEARRELMFLLGMDREDPAPEPTDHFDIQDTLPVDEILASALHQNSLVQIASAELSLAETERRLQGSNRYPSLSAQARYGYQRQENDAGLLRSQEQTGYTAMLNLRYSIFDGGVTSRSVQNARISEKSREENRLLVQKQVEKDVLTHFEAFQTRLRQLDIAELNVETAGLNYETAQQAFQIGQITSTELREAQLNLLEARRQQSELKYLIKIQEMQLLVLSGELLSEDDS